MRKDKYISEDVSKCNSEHVALLCISIFPWPNYVIDQDNQNAWIIIFWQFAYNKTQSKRS